MCFNPRKPTKALFFGLFAVFAPSILGAESVPSCAEKVRQILNGTLSIGSINNVTISRCIYGGYVHGLDGNFPREDYLALTYECTGSTASLGRAWLCSNRPKVALPSVAAASSRPTRRKQPVSTYLINPSRCAPFQPFAATQCVSDGITWCRPSITLPLHSILSTLTLTLVTSGPPPLSSTPFLALKGQQLTVTLDSQHRSNLDISTRNLVDTPIRWRVEKEAPDDSSVGVELARVAPDIPRSGSVEFPPNRLLPDPSPRYPSTTATCRNRSGRNRIAPVRSPTHPTTYLTTATSRRNPRGGIQTDAPRCAIPRKLFQPI